MFRVLDLCSGIGGFSLGLKRAGGFKTVCYVEIDEYCQRVLRDRMLDGSLDMAPIWDDLTKFDGYPWRGQADVITAGFPCQDISLAGKHAGIEGSRSGLFSQVARVVRDVRPTYVILENVAALYLRGLGTVLRELYRLGYDAGWEVISACSVGAPQVRKRMFIVAYPNGLSGRWDLRERGNEAARSRWWSSEPGVGRMAHGVPSRLDRNKALGNSVVPEIVEWIGRRIMKVQS